MQDVIKTLEAKLEAEKTLLITIQEQFGVSDPAYDEQEKVIKAYETAIIVLKRIDVERIAEVIRMNIPLYLTNDSHPAGFVFPIPLINEKKRKKVAQAIITELIKKD